MRYLVGEFSVSGRQHQVLILGGTGEARREGLGLEIGAHEQEALPRLEVEGRQRTARAITEVASA